MRTRTPEDYDPDRERGLYRKFDVRRVPPNPIAHPDCDYFVLDITHDKLAVFALRAYADAAERFGYQLLSDELRLKAEEAAERLGA